MFACVCLCVSELFMFVSDKTQLIIQEKTLPNIFSQCSYVNKYCSIQPFLVQTHSETGNIQMESTYLNFEYIL